LIRKLDSKSKAASNVVITAAVPASMDD
jgi:hypothetical protein